MVHHTPSYDTLYKALLRWRFYPNLYLFETLPIPIPFMHLKTLQGDLKKKWNYKKHCIAKSILYATCGLTFPNIAKYYLATQLRPLASWCTFHTYHRLTQVEKL